MRIPCPPRLKVVVITVALTALGASSGSTPAHGADKSTPAASTSFTVTGELTGVVAVSSTQAWAVGWTGGIGDAKTLIVHWNGRKWFPVTNPKPIPGTLIGMTKVSRTDIWAVRSPAP